MKKSLLALAVLGAFAGAASAQSSVTIYGSLDQAISKGNGGTAFNPGANGTSRAWQVRQSNTSRLGFRGNEDLGGGLSAQFQIEHRFNPDTGELNNGLAFWHGRSYVQLSHASLGRVYLGREYAPSFWTQNKSDPFGNDGVGQFPVDIAWAGYRVPSTVIAGTNASSRTSNTIGYKSPSFGGLTLNVATGLGENATSPGAGGVGRNDGFNIEYGAGPIYAAVSYERTRGGNPAFDGNNLVTAAFHYDLGMIKPIFYASRAEVGVNDQFTNKYWFIGALAPVGPGTVKFGYGRLTDEWGIVGGGGTVGVEVKKQKLGIGYDYALSKRTNLYLDAGFAKADNASNNRAFAFGVKHTF